MAAPTVTATGDLSLPTGADTFRVESSNWDPQVEPRRNLEDLLPAGPCVPEGLTFEHAAWLMTVGTPYNFTGELDSSSDQVPTNETQQEPRRLTELYLRGVMFVWDPAQADALLNERPAVRHLGRAIAPQVWEPGTPPTEGSRVSCAQFALDVDLLPDSQDDTSDTSLVFAPKPGTSYNVIILEASAQREPSSSTSLSDTATPTSANSTKKGSSNAGKIVPAVLIPLLLLAAIIAGLFFWRKKRRERMAPSAAFRAEHPNGIDVTYATPPASAPPMAEASELPTYANAAGGSSGPARYFPTQEKRPFLYNKTSS